MQSEVCMAIAVQWGGTARKRSLTRPQPNGRITDVIFVKYITSYLKKYEEYTL